MTSQWVAPAYSDGSIADLIESVCDGLAVPGAWDRLSLGANARVAVLVIDGLGHEQLSEHRDLVPALWAADRRVVTSVTPSTTPVALTSLGTGLPPGSHGLVGASFRIPETGELLWPLAWRDRPPPSLIQPEPTWWGRAAQAGVTVTAVSPRAYAGGGLTAAALRGAEYVGADGPGERIAEIAHALRQGDRALVYGYWEFVDRAAHIHGVDSPQYRAELVAADEFVARLAASMPAGSRLIVTSDHGLVDCPDAVVLDDLSGLWADVEVVAGEPRFRHVYTRPGAETAVARVWQDLLGEAAEVLTRAQAVERGWFGTVLPDVTGRIGDVVAVASGHVRLALPSRDSVVSSLIGQHGSLTAAEMNVPLALIDV